MPDVILQCFRCGESLAALSLPLSQRDACPSCAVLLHCCRMCVHFDQQVAKKCREDDAEEVTEKDRMNFCPWFEPGRDDFDAAAAAASRKAAASLAALFGEARETDAPAPGSTAADDLFK